MFDILTPATTLPLIITLFWAEQKAKKLGILDFLTTIPQPTGWNSVAGKIKTVLWQFDALGLTLLAAGVSLILLPLTLSETASNGWKNRKPASKVVFQI